MIPVLLLLSSLLQATSPEPAATPAPSASAEIKFSFENAQLDPSSYVIVIHEDGSGHYSSTPGLSSGAGDDVAPSPHDRDIQIQDPLRASFFAVARSHHFFDIACEAKGLHVAFTGKKLLAYTGADGKGGCTYNWSRDTQINQLGNQMISIAATLEAGRRLTIEHEHSRLSLDAELENLDDAVKAHRALAVENIAPVLQSIADDENVLNRARQRARALLAGAASVH
jgi:hypothetical protein